MTRWTHVTTRVYLISMLARAHTQKHVCTRDQRCVRCNVGHVCTPGSKCAQCPTLAYRIHLRPPLATRAFQKARVHTCHLILMWARVRTRDHVSQPVHACLIDLVVHTRADTCVHKGPRMHSDLRVCVWPGCGHACTQPSTCAQVAKRAYATSLCAHVCTREKQDAQAWPCVFISSTRDHVCTRKSTCAHVATRVYSIPVWADKIARVHMRLGVFV